MSENENNSHAVFVDEAELAKILNIETGTIRKMVTDGVLVRAYRGKYNRDACVRLYIEYLQAIARKRQKVTAEDADLAQENARLRKIQADKAQFELDILHKNYYEADGVIEDVQKVVANARSKLLALPSRLASLGFGAKTQAELQKIAKNIIYEVLDELVTPDFGDDREELEDGT